MRPLVTGWQGQVARALTEAALRRPDIKAAAIGRPALDLCDVPTIRRALADVEPDIVINTAAYTAVDKAESEVAQAFALNRDGAGAIAAVAAERGIPIIHVSTDYVFDGTKPSPYTETDPTGPTSVYGRSKLEGEAAVAAANPRHVILRTAWVVSPWGHNFVKTMLRLAEARPELKVVDDQIGCPTYAPHLAEAILDVAAGMLGAPQRPVAGIYHATNAGEVTWCGLAREIFAHAAREGLAHSRVAPIATSEYPTPARRPANSRLDCARLAQTFGVRLPPWQAGIADCVQRLAAVAREAGVKPA